MKKIILLALLCVQCHGKEVAKPEKEVGRLDRLIETSVGISKVILKPVKFAYDNSEKILSKKTLAFLALIGAPYFYYNPDALTQISLIGADAVVKMNGLIARGILEGLMSNPAALANFMALMTAQSAGSAFVKGFGEKIGTALLTIFTI